ncbi:MAG TPA: hypothetical protein VLJ76_07755, partial [Gaiellaceae bacterium]|nr:hypothetical protein [Gaiellaceae bacterium]
AADPVFTVAATSSKVVVAVRRGAATVVGKDAHKGVVVGVNTDQSKGTAKQVTITGGGNPTQPQTVSGPPDAGLSALANKVPASTDVTPPSTTFAVVPPAVNGQSPFAFEFRSIPAVVSTLFSCSLNGGPFYACSTGNPLPVPPGPDTLAVKATDEAGNTGDPVSTSWYQERSPNAPIVFEADRSPGRYELYQVDPDGKNLKQLTTTSGFDPSWSPNGKQIAYESDKDQAKGSEIYILTLGSTGPPLRLTDNPANDRTPRWSPDGKSIVFASDRNGGVYQLYVMAADRSSGDNPRQLTFLGANHDPSWSTENKIAFVSTRDGKSEIYVMNADGTGRQRPLTKTSQGDNLNPSWSSDGKSIVFESDRDGNEEIYMMNANGTGQQRLTFNPARDSNPVFSPDGKRIAFSSNRAGKSSVDIWVAVLHERNLARITNIGTKDLSPSW